MSFGNILPQINYRDRPAAYAVITSGDGKIAVVKGTRGYFLPGGGSLEGETPEETVRRELLEELARDIVITGKIGEAVQYYSAGDAHYKMKAIFFKAAFSGGRRGEAENELIWLDAKESEGAFFYQCHEWAIREGGCL